MTYQLVTYLVHVELGASGECGVHVNIDARGRHAHGLGSRNELGQIIRHRDTLAEGVHTAGRVAEHRMRGVHVAGKRVRDLVPEESTLRSGHADRGRRAQVELGREILAVLARGVGTQARVNVLSKRGEKVTKKKNSIINEKTML